MSEDQGMLSSALWSVKAFFRFASISAFGNYWLTYLGYFPEGLHLLVFILSRSVIAFDSVAKRIFEWDPATEFRALAGCGIISIFSVLASTLQSEAPGLFDLSIAISNCPLLLAILGSMILIQDPESHLNRSGLASILILYVSTIAYYRHYRSDLLPLAVSASVLISIIWTTVSMISSQLLDAHLELKHANTELEARSAQKHVLALELAEANSKMQESYQMLEARSMQERTFLQTLFDATLQIDVMDEGLIVESSPSADNLFCTRMCGARLQDAIPDGTPSCTKFISDICSRFKCTKTEKVGDPNHHWPTLDSYAQGAYSESIGSTGTANVPSVVRSLATFSDALGAHFECEMIAFLLEQAEERYGLAFLGLRLCGEKREAKDLMSQAPILTEDAELLSIPEVSATTAPGRSSSLLRRIREKGETESFAKASSVPDSVHHAALVTSIAKVTEGHADDEGGCRANVDIKGHALEVTSLHPASAPGDAGVLAARPQRAQGAVSDHGTEFGTEISFAISGTTTTARPRRPRTRAVAVQTDPAGPSALPPLMPGLGELAALRRAGVPQGRRARRHARVFLNTSRRQVPGFEETPWTTRRMRLIDAMGGINACGHGCCALHVSVAAARRTLDTIGRDKCEGINFGSRQCPDCFALFDRVVDTVEMDATDGTTLQECETCGASICPLSPSGSTPAGSTPNVSDERSLVAPVSAPFPGASVFKITIDKSGGDKLGIDVDLCDGKALLVEKVEEGLFEQWNAHNKEAEVRIGDYLVEVNGISGNSEQIIAECGENKLLELVVLRSGPTERS